MIKWIVIIGFCVIVGGFLFLNYLYKKTNDYRNTRIDIKEFDNHMPNNLQIVNLGSTYSKYAFGTARELGLNWGDFSLQSQSLEMDYAILKKNISKVAPGGVVIIVVAAACLMLYKEKQENLLYYSILKKKEHPNYKIKNKLFSVFPLLKYPTKVIRILFDKIPYESIYDRYPNVLSQEQSEVELARLVNVWKEIFELDDMKSVNLTDKIVGNINYNKVILDKIIELCKSKELQPIIVVTPFSERLNKYFSEEFKVEVIENGIKECVQKNKIVYLNYQDDEYFQTRVELFADGGFRLNERGSKIFIKRVLDDLKIHGYILNNSEIGIRR